MINSGIKWYAVIWYMRKKMIYYNIYTSTYNVHMQMLLPKHVLVHIQDENDELILLLYVSTIYDTILIKVISDISVCK